MYELSTGLSSVVISESLGISSEYFFTVDDAFEQYSVNLPGCHECWTLSCNLQVNKQSLAASWRGITILHSLVCLQPGVRRPSLLSMFKISLESLGGSRVSQMEGGSQLL